MNDDDECRHYGDASSCPKRCTCGHTCAEHAGGQSHCGACACAEFDGADRHALGALLGVETVRQQWMRPENVWFRCKGCGQPAMYFGAGLPPYYPPGSIGHSKPAGTARVDTSQPSRVACALYHQCSAEEFWDLHQDAERLEPPTDLRAFTGGN